MDIKAREGTYEQKVKCVNCSYTGPIDIPKGQSVTGTECPRCGCISLDKDTTVVW